MDLKKTQSKLQSYIFIPIADPGSKMSMMNPAF